MDIADGVFGNMDVKSLFELILFSQPDGFDSVQHDYYRKNI